MATVSGDGAYDTKACHAAIAARGAAAVIPTRKNAQTWKGSSAGVEARNETLRSTRHLGRTIWKKWSGYHRRSLVETKMNCFKRLGERYLSEALQGRTTGFSNLHQLITDLHEGQRKALPCGAGLKMLAVDHEGGLNLCHRFTGSSLPTFGDVKTGIEKQALGEFLDQRLDRSGTGCDSCRIRNLCSGGCYHESYARYGDPQHPTYHYCELMRDWVDFGIEVYSRIMAGNPAFIEQHITPRRAS